MILLDPELLAELKFEGVFRFAKAGVDLGVAKGVVDLDVAKGVVDLGVAKGVVDKDVTNGETEDFGVVLNGTTMLLRNFGVLLALIF